MSNGAGGVSPLDLLPPDVGGAAFAVMLMVSFAGSFITIAFGIGGGGLVLAVLASLLPPAALIPVHGAVQFGSNVTRAGLLLGQVSWRTVPGFAVGAVVGAALGGVVVVDLPPGLVQAGVGAFLIWTIVARPPAWLTRWPWLAGGVSTFLTMFFGATGLFVAGFTRSLGLPRHGYVATHATLMTLQHGLKIAMFGLLGFAFGTWAALALALIAAGFAGTLCGRLVLNRITDTAFRRVLDVILVLISLRLIWAGLVAE